ncbi:MAG: hypothetical protein B7733_17000 [Myxococcales bacterium FL481]|nr:MAG: hypothetical protein B7733_17000 [Myxococcales bacterium FL481]
METTPTLADIHANLFNADCDLSLDEIAAAVLNTDLDEAYDALPEDSDERCEFGDLMQALYWAFNDCHGGQFTDCYRAHCHVSGIYTPGAVEDGPDEDSVASMLYDALVERI